MTTVAMTTLEARMRSAAGKRLTLSLGLSMLAHVTAIAIVAGLLKPMLMPELGHTGQALPIEVALVSIRPIAFTAPPESPALATEMLFVPKPAGRAPPAPEVPPPSPPRTEVLTTRAPLGVSVHSDASANAVSANAAPPPGDTAVVAITDSELLGHAQALRLAQRFPRATAKPPRPSAPLVVPYPPRAARAHTEARIAALLLLDAAGQITSTTLFPDESLFGPTILEALNGVRFVPAEADAKPIPYWVILEFVFTMRPAPVVPRPLG